MYVMQVITVYVSTDDVAEIYNKINNLCAPHDHDKNLMAPH